jgi:hypothetical protein
VSDRITEEGEAETHGINDHENDQDADKDDNDEEDAVTETDHQTTNAQVQKLLMANPRLPEDERYYLHTNASMIRKLVQILMHHYPERLSRALIVPYIGNVAYFRTVVGARLALASAVGSNRTRHKVKFLKHFADLKAYVKKDELVTIVGGTAPIDPVVFEAR